jgi:PAS domain S-box-containing protein
VSEFSDSNSAVCPVALQVLNASPDAVVVANAEFRVLCVNDHVQSTLRYSSDDLVSTSIEHLIAPRDRDRFKALLEHALKFPGTGGERLPGETAVLRGDGTTFTAEIGINALNQDGRHFAVLSLRDISRHKRIENELQTSQLLLAEAQRVAQLGSWRWNVAEDHITWSNELYRLFGVDKTSEPITYGTFISLIHPADRERIKAIISDALERHSSFEMEHRIIRPDGMVRLIYGQGAMGRADDGNVVSMIGTAQDVTEHRANEAQAFQLALEQAARQEAERTKERFQFLAEVSEALSTSLEYEATLGKLMRLIIPRQADWCSINTLEASGKINRLAVAHRDAEKQKILESIRERGFLPHGDTSHPLTRALRDARPELHAEVTPDILRRMARSEEHFELSIKLNPTSVMLVPLIARGRAFGVITFGMSDSGRRYTDDDLHLATEVAHRAAVSIDNAHLYHDAQEAARAREEFVSLVSHELKTPLTVIKGYIQVMERYLEKPEWDRERIKTSRERLSTQVNRLELLVSDILDVSRMQRGRLDLSLEPETDLAALAQQVVDRFDDAIERTASHELRVHAQEPVVGNWDPLRLDQVFSNLLSNALKYSPEGGKIDVVLWREDDTAFVNVQDNGVGISPEEQRSLFQPFQRGAAASRGISGTGLGLYITRQIIEQHGGSISVTSTPGESTTFHITLPLSPAVDEDLTRA